MSMKVLARSSKWNGGCMTLLTGVSRGIQGLRLSYHKKIKRKDTDEEPTEKDYDNAAAASDPKRLTVRYRKTACRLDERPN